MYRGKITASPWVGARRRALTSRGLLPRLPAAAWICTLVAILNAASWGFITPPFQAIDEQDHVAYVKQFAETGRKPIRTTAGSYEPEEFFALQALHYTRIRLRPANGEILSAAEQRALEVGLRKERYPANPKGINAGTATSEPPLYYALESVPYLLDLKGSLLERLQLMRLISALMAGFTALFTFLFLREAIPRVRWAWTVGALGVALSPLLGFMSGAVNPDAMLFAVSAAIFYCLARAFQRGFTARSAIATGFAVLVGFATKLSFLGLVPGIFLALSILSIRGWRRSGLRGVRDPLIAMALAAVPPCAYLLARGIASHHPGAAVTSALGELHGSLINRANYIWQVYLPHVPGTRNFFPGLFTARQIWFDGYVGKFGWLDTAFPGWVYTFALVAAVAIAALCLRELIADRVSLRSRVGELASYALMSLGMMVLLGLASYLVFPGKLLEYGQTRYLLPLLPLLAAALALAARGAGRRWGPATGALIVVLLFAHDIFSQLQTVARYYG